MKNILEKINLRFKPHILTEDEILRLYKIPCDKNDQLRQARLSSEKEFKKSTRLKKFYYLDEQIDLFINNFTLANTSDEEFIDMARHINNHSRGKVKQIKRLFGNAGFEITTKDYTMKVIKAYEFFSNLLEPMPDLDKQERDGGCHYHAYQFSTLLALMDIPNEVVSGYIYEGFKDETYSHSWVEFKSEKGTDLVFDGNRGAIITKDGYYKIKHPKNLSRISHKDIVCEQTILHGLENIADGWANKLWFHDREMALKVYENYYGKKFVPKDYEECMKNPAIIVKLDDINKAKELQFEA